MRIPVEPFLFYPNLLLERLKQETPFKDKKISKPNRHKIWKYTPKGQKETLFVSLFYKVTSDYRYFHRQVEQLEKGEKQDGFINPGVFIETATYLGITYPESISVGHLAPFAVERVKILFQKFLMEHMPEYWSLNKRKYQVFEEGTGELSYSQANAKEKAPGTLELENAENAILSFFDAVSSHDYESAWALIDQNMKDRIWKGSFENFVEGYKNTLKISQIHIWDMRVSARNFTGKVFYMDKVLLRYSIDQMILTKLSLGEADKFVSIINAMLDQAKRVGIKNFENLEIFKAQEKTFSEYSRYKCPTDIESIEKVFPLEQTESIARLYEVICSKSQSGFKIKSIIPIKGINLR